MSRLLSQGTGKFRESANTGVFVCAHVAAGAPVLQVFHDAEGDWQFFCGGIHNEAAGDRPLLLCLGDVLARDATLNEVAKMCTANRADRPSASSAWTVTDESEEFIRRCIADVGWSVQLVQAGDSAHEPAFAYTVGLHESHGHPELIIVGQPHALMHSALNEIGERIRAGTRFSPGESLDGVIEGYPVRLREVLEAKSFTEHVGYALWFYGGQTFRLFQVVWPDKDGHFPGEPGAWEILRTREPLLP